MKVSALIEDAQRYVVGYYDDEDEMYVHWTEDDWLSYIKLAVGILATVDPELFTKTVDVELVPGAVQEIPAQCKTLRSVRGQRDDTGAISRLVRKRSSSTLKLPGIMRKTCKIKTVSDDEYVVKSYTVDEFDEKVIIVDPPVPNGRTATLVITCYSPPDIKDVNEELPINATHASIIFELLLYYAWGVDIEDTANRERSNTHWNNALKLMDITDAVMTKLLRGHKAKAVTNG